MGVRYNAAFVHGDDLSLAMRKRVERLLARSGYNAVVERSAGVWEPVHLVKYEESPRFQITENPTRPGVYRVYTSYYSDPRFCFFDGKGWCTDTAHTPQQAAERANQIWVLFLDAALVRRSLGIRSWSGLARNPTKFH